MSLASSIGATHRRLGFAAASAANLETVTFTAPGGVGASIAVKMKRQHSGDQDGEALSEFQALCLINRDDVATLTPNQSGDFGTILDAAGRTYYITRITGQTATAYKVLLSHTRHRLGGNPRGHVG